jgi:LmbE family N-acetylglucosaminyl deacetylase
MGNNVYVPESAMAIVAHPDDIEFSCAGTMARWAKAGARISYVLCTSGDVGIAEPGMTHERATEIREFESRNAAEIAGVTEIIFLREPDGMLQATMELRKRLVREIRRFKPEVVVTGDPNQLFSDDYLNHPDHRAASLAAIDAIFPASGQPNLFEDIEQEFGYKAHKPRKTFITSWENSTYFVDITDTIEVKIQALRAHKSQMGDWDPTEMIKKWSSERARGKEMEYAESYRVIQMINDEEWEKQKKMS